MYVSFDKIIADTLDMNPVLIKSTPFNARWINSKGYVINRTVFITTTVAATYD